MDLSVSTTNNLEMKVTVGKDGFIPVKATEESAGFDLSVPRTIRISPGAVYCIDTNVSIEMPKGYAAFIKPRSSYAVKGLVVLGGVIDNDFRGMIQVLVSAIGDDSILLIAGRRFVQLVPIQTGNFNLHVVTELTATKRGSGMLGSTDNHTQVVAATTTEETQRIEVDDDDEDDDDDNDYQESQQ